MWFILSLCVLLCLSECYSYDYKDGFLQDIDPDWASISGRINQPKCIDIPSNLTLCQNIGYTQMRLPNLLDHDTIEEVRQQSKSWTSLLGVHCHPDTKLFLCSLFTPVCLDRKIYRVEVCVMPSRRAASRRCSSTTIVGLIWSDVTSFPKTQISV